MPDALEFTALDTFRLTKDEIAQIEVIQLLRGLPSLRAALTHAIETEYRMVLDEGVRMSSRPPERNGKRVLTFGQGGGISAGPR